MQFFKSVAQALTDFNELNPIAPLQLLLEVRSLFLFILLDIATVWILYIYSLT